MSRRQYFFLFALLVAGAVLRVMYHDVPSYSRADELIYVKYACRVAAHGLGEMPNLTREYNANPGQHGFPGPFRWGYVLPAAAAFVVAKNCTFGILGWVSTFFGVLALLGTFLVARQLLGVKAALVATAFSVTSTLGLALSRRALADAPFCAVALCALWLLLRAVQAEKPRIADYGVALFALTWCFAIKATFTLMLPGLAAVIVLERGVRRLRWQDALLIGLPPLLAVSGFMLLTHGTSEFINAWHNELDALGQPYTLRYQAGAWQRVILDLLALSPGVTLLAVMAVGYALFSGQVTKGALELLVLLAVTVAAFALAPSKSARFLLVVDALARMASAWVLVARAPALPRFGPLLAGLIVALNALSEYGLFRSVFITAGVYDPVSDNVFRALHIIP
jgi:4-amino-4-deoxy-L-arabinose transferase-like glycosyltransferase